MTWDSNNLIGIYIALGIYFALLALAALSGFFKMKRHRRGEGQEQDGKTMVDDDVDDVLEAHYLGNRDFGPILTAGSLFSSFFSGYTVVGVPDEAYYSGWTALRWMVATLSIVFGLMATGARLRKVGILRNHQSPVDFVTDRYQSQILRYTMVFFMIVPAIIYLTAQLVAIKSTFNALFNIHPDSPYAVITIGGLIVIFEWMGGLSSVALTDCIQGFIMVACFITLPIVITRNYGGWKELDWEVYPKQEYYQTPSTKDQWMFWNFVFILFSAGLQPHLIQRVYAAKTFKALKVGYSVLAIGPWLTSLAGVFIGTVGVQILHDGGVEVTSPFANMLEMVMDLGGFPYVIGVVASTATLSSIMSTADSVLISLSQLLTSEVIKPNFPNIKGQSLANIGRVTSLVAMGAGLTMTLFGGKGISQLVILQMSIFVHGMPGYFLALFGTRRWNCHPWIISFSAFAGLSASLILYFSNVGENIPMNSGLLGILMNLIILVFMESIRRFVVTIRSRNNTRNIATVTEGQGQNDVEGHDFACTETNPSNEFCLPGWDRPELSKFGKERLSSDYVWTVMENVREPVKESWFVILVVVMSILSSPFTASSSMPPLGNDGMLMWEPAVLAGIPSWAAKIIITMIPTTLFLLYSISVIPNNLFPERTNKEEQPVGLVKNNKNNGTTVGRSSASERPKEDDDDDNDDNAKTEKQKNMKSASPSASASVPNSRRRRGSSGLLSFVGRDASVRHLRQLSLDDGNVTCDDDEDDDGSSVY